MADDKESKEESEVWPAEVEEAKTVTRSSHNAGKSDMTSSAYQVAILEADLDSTSQLH